MDSVFRSPVSRWAPTPRSRHTRHVGRSVHSAQQTVALGLSRARLLNRQKPEDLRPELLRRPLHIFEVDGSPSSGSNTAALPQPRSARSFEASSLSDVRSSGSWANWDTGTLGLFSARQSPHSLALQARASELSSSIAPEAWHPQSSCCRKPGTHTRAMLISPTKSSERAISTSCSCRRGFSHSVLGQCTIGRDCSGLCCPLDSRSFVVETNPYSQRREP
jgi:hypothetical protein